MPRPQSTDRRWWLEPTGQAHRVVIANAKHLVDKASSRHEMDRRHMRLYGGSKFVGLTPQSYSYVLPDSDRVAWNVIASVIDTYVAKMLRSTPAPMFLTNGGNYDDRRKATKLNKFGKGCLHQSGIYRIGATIERDAAIFGTGIAQLYSEGNRLYSERVFPWEMLVDDVEAMYGEPRSLYRRKFIDRAVLADRFAKDAEVREAIESAPEASKEAIGRDTLSEQIEVIEAWHLPSGRKAKDGRHVIAVDGATLLDEEWTRERFPFAVRRYVDPVAGFWGIGIAERLTGIQLEINKLLKRIREAHHMLGRPIVILDEACGIPETHITNEVASIVVKNAGSPGDIRVDTSPTMPPDVYQHLMTLRGQAYEEIGVSQLDASAKKPAGIDSGAALREYNDIGSERFLPQGKRREEWHIDAVRISLDEVREIEDFEVDVPDRKYSEKVSWKDVNLDDDAYTLQCFPSSMLPQTPAGRMQAVQEYIASGLIPQDQALDLLDIPDLDDYRQRATAPLNAVRSRVDAMLDGRPYEAPEAFDNPDIILAYALPTYLEERESGCPEDRLAELRRYINEAIALKQPPPQEPAPMGVDPAAMGALPQAVPAMGAPTDPLVAAPMAA